MLLFESRDHLRQVLRAHLDEPASREVLSHSQAAIALVETQDESDSWLHGDAMLQSGAAWPHVHGKALKHTARVKLDGLPEVLPSQPKSGYLSFFDGYPWGDEVEWKFDEYGAVIYDDGSSVAEMPCPLDSDELENYWPTERQYVVPEGPYWSVPSYSETREMSFELDSETHRGLGLELEKESIRTRFAGQLFGRPQPIQAETTPRPTNNRHDAEYYDDHWIHLATFDDGVNFEYYFAVRFAELKNLKFSDPVFSAQC